MTSFLFSVQPLAKHSQGCLVQKNHTKINDDEDDRDNLGKQLIYSRIIMIMVMLVMIMIMVVGTMISNGEDDDKYYDDDMDKKCHL